MTRRMTITVKNNGIDELWVLNSEHLEHGKWMSGSPPAQVPRNGTAIIKSEKTTGSFYGTTGWIKYTSTVKPGSTMTITWNKPYGTDPTTCVVDMNSIDYTAKVENRDFQKSEAFCDVVIYKNTQPVIDTKNWMGKLPAGTLLNSVIMPGSHDAGMAELHHCSIGANDGNTQTQQLDIRGQLEAGSRYFDIRVDYDHDALVTYHRGGPGDMFGCNGQFLDTVLNQAVSFLRDYPTETAIMKFSHIRDNSIDTKRRIEQLLLSAPFHSYLFRGSNNNLAGVKVSDAAGKMLVVMDYDETIHPEVGFFRFHDGFVNNVCAYRGLNVTVCDQYSDTDSYIQMATDQIAKWDAYAGFGKDYLFLLSWTLTAGASGSIRSLAKEANDQLPNVLAGQIIERGKGKPNIVYIDFVNVETTRAIIGYNF